MTEIYDKTKNYYNHFLPTDHIDDLSDHWEGNTLKLRSKHALSCGHN